MTFAIHSWTAADGAELRYGLLTSSDDAPLKNPRRGMVFVPGLGGSVKNSLVFFNALLQHFSPIVVPDLRGFGLNEHHPLPNPIQFVDDLNGLIAHAAPLHTGQQPWMLGGISLGGCVVSHYLGQPVNKANLSTFLLPDSVWLLAPAVQEHPQMFRWRYVAKTLWTLFTRPQTLIQLPYGLEALTQNPAVLASKQYQQHMADFYIPAGFLWQLRRFNRSAGLQLHGVTQPIHLSIPLADRIICPTAMERLFQQLPLHPHHFCGRYPGLYHDVPLEIQMPAVVADVGAWASQLPFVLRRTQPNASAPFPSVV
ncbi:MAG: alpha/beta fold hydrolase [Vampirovibrionales bacterium]|nr:alpha/beta fold hydrolase [Vampirovibrionales bacterium]